MKKYVLAVGACLTAFSLSAGCTLGPNGINQWRLVYEVGQCLDACCSTIEATLTALDLGFLTLVDFAALTLVEPLVSILEACDLCSHFDIIINQNSDLDACCSRVESVVDQLDTCLLGTVITQSMLPYTITQAGLYTVCEDLILSGGVTPAITISSARDVRLDLNGHRVYSSSPTALTISVEDSHEVTVTNGALGSTFTTTANISDNSDQIRFSDINVVSSGSTAFNIEDSTNVTLERCNCTGSGVISDPVIWIRGSSDGIFLNSCTVFDSPLDAFSVDVTPATVYGIFFEDCHALHTDAGPFVGNGFYVTTNGNTVVPVSFKRCTATFYGFGFLVSASSDIYFEECSTTICTALGFDLISCSDFILEKCDSQGVTSSAFTFDSCNVGTVQNSAAIGFSGGAPGPGVLLHSCNDICIDSCTVQTFDSNGYEIDASSRITAKNCVAEGCGGVGPATGGYYVGSASDSMLFVDCIAQGNSTGFNILANNVVLQECAVTQNSVGVEIFAGASATALLMTCPINNSTADIIDNGIDTVNISECTLAECCSRVESVVDQLDTCLLGTVITQSMLPYTITEAGLYTVCEDLILSGGGTPAITISSARDVRLDLNGHRVYSNSGSATAFAISVVNSQEVEVTNGALGTTFTTTAKVSSSSNQIRFSDINVVSSGSTAFDIEDSTDVTLERCNCVSSVVAFDPVINVHGTSDGIFLNSCTVFDSPRDAFSVDVTPATIYGIFFEDCHALHTTGFIGVGNGFYASTNGNTVVPVSFKRCTATFYGFGFLVSASSDIYFEECSTTVCTALGFDLISCSDFILEKCDSQGVTGSAFTFDTCNVGRVQNSAAVGFGASGGGVGYFLNSCQDMLMENCSAEKFQTVGFQLDVSTGIVLDTCTAMSGTAGTGVLISADSTATIRRCEVDNNNIGISATSTTSSTDIIIKDCMVAHNITNGIVDNGTPIWILDTRSINPGPDSIAASTGAGTVITY